MANEARTEVTRELGPELDGLDLSDLNPRALVAQAPRWTRLDDDDDDEPTRTRGTRRQNGAVSRRPGTDLSPRRRTPAAYDPDTT